MATVNKYISTERYQGRTQNTEAEEHEANISIGPVRELRRVQMFFQHVIKPSQEHLPGELKR